MIYISREVNGVECAETLHNLNRLYPEFPPLQERHLRDGYWWLMFGGSEIVGFAGMVPFTPFPDVGYLKRCYILREHRGAGLQKRLLQVREERARDIEWTMLVSEVSAGNYSSNQNFVKSGFKQVEPEQPWGKCPSLYWVKTLSA